MLVSIFTDDSTNNSNHDIGNVNLEMASYDLYSGTIPYDILFYKFYFKI